MKNLLTVSLKLILIACTLTLISCHSDDEPTSEAETLQMNDDKLDNKTLQELALFNYSIKKDIQTRSFISRLWKTITKVGADVYGGAKGFGHSFEIRNGKLYFDLATVLMEGSSHSRKAAEEADAQLVMNSDEDFFDDIKSYCREKISFDHVINVGNNSNYLTCNTNTISFIGDSLYSQIMIPSSMECLLVTGIAHNEILEDNLYGRSVLNGNSHNELNSNPPELDNPDPDDGHDDHLESEEFSELYYSGIAKVDSCCGINGFGYQTYLVNYPFDSSNVNQTMGLFMDAMMNSVETSSDIVSLVNNYISIIENNNDFTPEERAQIYTGLIISVYSFNLWYARDSRLPPILL